LDDLIEPVLGPTWLALYMRRTILSENQYEPKFIATAKKKPNISP